MSNRAVSIPRTVDGALLTLRDTLADELRFADIEVPLRTLCSCARDEGVAPEHLLVRLTQTLADVPRCDDRRQPHNESKCIRDRIVSFTIDAYFSDRMRADDRRLDS